MIGFGSGRGEAPRILRSRSSARWRGSPSPGTRSGSTSAISVFFGCADSGTVYSIDRVGFAPPSPWAKTSFSFFGVPWQLSPRCTTTGAVLPAARTWS